MSPLCNTCLIGLSYQNWISRAEQLHFRRAQCWLGWGWGYGHPQASHWDTTLIGFSLWVRRCSCLVPVNSCYPLVLVSVEQAHWSLETGCWPSTVCVWRTAPWRMPCTSCSRRRTWSNSEYRRMRTTLVHYAYNTVLYMICSEKEPNVLTLQYFRPLHAYQAMHP